jgi:hypothetical protein
MRADTAAAYVDEPSVEAFLRRAGTVYPRGRNITGRGRVWAKGDLDMAIAVLTGHREGGSLAADL